MQDCDEIGGWRDDALLEALEQIITEHDQVVSERDSKEEEDQREDMHDSL